jgi:hypothetical protein
MDTEGRRDVNEVRRQSRVLAKLLDDGRASANQGPWRALGCPRQRVDLFSPCSLCGALRQPLFEPRRPDPQSSPAKPIQIKLLGFAWFYSSKSGLINGLQRFQIRIFLLVLGHIARRGWPARLTFSDYCDDVGRIPIFARWRPKNCGASLMACALRPPFGRAHAGRRPLHEPLFGRSSTDGRGTVQHSDISWSRKGPFEPIDLFEPPSETSSPV